MLFISNLHLYIFSFLFPFVWLIEKSTDIANILIDFSISLFSYLSFGVVMRQVHMMRTAISSRNNCRFYQYEIFLIIPKSIFSLKFKYFDTNIVIPVRFAQYIFFYFLPTLFFLLCKVAFLQTTFIFLFLIIQSLKVSF